MLLSDSATLHYDNQSKLRDRKLLGACVTTFCCSKLMACENNVATRQTLGLTISKTRGMALLLPRPPISNSIKDFAVLETLLNLFAILLPSSSAPQKRSSYIKEVFRDCGEEIIDLLNAAPTKDWDETAAKVIDSLAEADISL